MKGKLARPTIGDVAAKARVAPTTVSRVLNGGYVSAEVRARVEKVIKTLGYVPSPTRSRRRLPDVAQPARKHRSRRRLLQPKTRPLCQWVRPRRFNRKAGRGEGENLLFAGPAARGESGRPDRPRWQTRWHAERFGAQRANPKKLPALPPSC